MKKIAALAAVLAAVSVVSVAGLTPVRAQQGQGGRFGRGMFQGLSLLSLPAPLATRLKLTDDQKTKLDSMRGALRQEMQAAFQEAQNGGDRQAALQKIQASRQKSDAEALALLTPEQKTQFEGMKKESAQYEGLGPASVALLAVDGLTDDQKSKLKALGADTKTKRDAILQSAQQSGDRQAARQQREALETDTSAAIHKILTEDQGKQFDAAVPQRRPGAGNAQ